MKVFISSFQCESNTFCSSMVQYNDFEVIIGSKVLERLAAVNVFKKYGFDVIPGVFASALPSGKVDKTTYNKIKDLILNFITKSKNLDGIYLYMHGAMYIDEIGSGEEDLIKEIRGNIGWNIPISVALDFHANNSRNFVHSVNIIHGFRTAPHTDQADTEIRAAEGLVRCLKEGVVPSAIMIKVPVLVGDAAVTAKEPLKGIIKKLKELDCDKRIYSAAIFNGQPWSDFEYTGPSVVISYCSGNAHAVEKAKELAIMYWEGRNKFRFDVTALNPQDAITAALSSENAPVFVTDSGDNTTAGAEGQGTLLLDIILKRNARDVLVCGITCKKAVDKLKDLSIGKEVSFTLGEDSDKPHIIPVPIQGIIKSRGKVLGWAGEDAGYGVVVSSKGIDIVVTDVRAAFLSEKHIKRMGIDIADYKVIVLKMGYLFPELRKIAAQNIFALTPGASTNVFNSLEYKHVPRPIYPLDKNFTWSPKVM